MTVDPRLYIVTASALRNATTRLLVYIKETQGEEKAKTLIRDHGRSLTLANVFDTFLDDLFDAALNEADTWRANLPKYEPWP